MIDKVLDLYNQFIVEEQEQGVLHEVPTSSYNGVWKTWKWVSLGLFAIFVFTFLDVARTLRRIEKKR